jgi:hypothetical protein
MMTVALHAGTVTEPVQRSMTREIETDIGNVTDNETKIVVVTVVKDRFISDLRERGQIRTLPVGSILQKSYSGWFNIAEKLHMLRHMQV